QMVEVTSLQDGIVTISESVTPGLFVTARASEVKAGDVVAKRGRPIGAAELAVLASFGYHSVKVGATPRVAIISTGSELVDVATTPVGPQIRNSNSYTIGSYAESAGARVTNIGTIKDSLDVTRDLLDRIANEHEIVITSGGVSMGDYDLVKAALL